MRIWVESFVALYFHVGFHYCVSGSLVFFFFFSLFQKRADDEALTRFLHTSLFFVSCQTSRVRRPVGPKGPPLPLGVLPTPATCVGQLFRVPGEPLHLA